MSLPQRLAEPAPNRPLTADFRRSSLGLGGSAPDDDESGQDIDMKDAGPSTAPLTGNPAFFRDD